jgi:hypothetical protein
MSCPTGTILACDFPNFLVDQTPKFDEIIMEDIRPTDGWLLNVSTGTTPMGTPVEITQDRFRHVFPNTTKAWTRVQANGPGCQGNPCDPTEHQIGWGADRLTYFAEQQTWATPLMCYDQDMHITQAEAHISQIINEILRPATTDVSSAFLRKRCLLWSKQKWAANSSMTPFTFQWTSPINGALGGPNGDEEIYFYTNISPSNVYLLAPQMLQNRFSPLMRRGYAGKNPFKETAPFIELVTDMDTCWQLDKLANNGGGSGNYNTPTVSGNWRFQEWNAASEFWRYGFSGQIGNFQVRVDEMGLRFNYVNDLGNSYTNRYQYQIILPYRNGITSGAGGAPGLGSDANPDYDVAQFAISYITHKKGMELLVPDSAPLSSEMPFGHRDFGGKWQFQMHDLGADANGVPIKNAWQNKGRFASWFKYYVRPLHTEFMEAIFHKRQQNVIPNIQTSNTDATNGYPVQEYNSSLPNCPLPASWPAGRVATQTGFGTDPVPSVNTVIQGVSVQISDGSSSNTTPVDTFQTSALNANTPDA